MNNTKKIRSMTAAAVIAALYVALTYSQNVIFPGSTSMAVQFRVSEALCVLALFTPSAIPGLTVGCVLANVVSLGALPVDMILGSLASFLAACFMYKTRNITFKGIPLLSLMMPAIFNGLIIGAEIEVFFIDGPFRFPSFLIQAGLVALGEIGVLYTLGLLLVKIIKNKKIEKYLKTV